MKVANVGRGLSMLKKRLTGNTMRNDSRLRKFMLLAASLGMIGIAWGGDTGIRKMGEEDDIQIAITGSASTRYAAYWTVIDHTGESYKFEEVGEVPASFSYEGKAIDGTVTVMSDPGLLEVEIRKSGNRSRSSTQGKGSRIKISVQ